VNRVAPETGLPPATPEAAAAGPHPATGRPRTLEPLLSGAARNALRHEIGFAILHRHSIA